MTRSTTLPRGTSATQGTPGTSSARAASTVPVDLHDVVAAGTPRAVRRWLDATGDPRVRADQLADLSDAQVRSLVALLDPGSARALLGSLPAHPAAEVLGVVPPVVAAGLVGSLEPDRAAEVLRALPDSDRAGVLAAMPAARSAVVRGLLAWPEGSAAARMTPEVLTVRPTMTVAEAREAVRVQTATAPHRDEPRAPGAADIYITAGPGTGGPEPAGPGAAVAGTGPVAHTLLGVLTFRDLVLAPADARVADLVHDDLVTVDPRADQEDAARLLHTHRLSALPVVADGQLLGVLTADDVADIDLEEVAEDAARQGGAEPLDVPYLRASPWRLWRTRIGWMLALFAAEMYTGSVLRAFEDELSTVVALTFFVPLLIGTGGNSGTQITTTLIRAMATGEVRLRDVGQVLRKELSTGAMIAATMALAAWVRAWTLGVGPEVGATVAISAAVIVLWTALVASVLPLVLRRLGADPAVVSGPMISTIVDGTGLIIYFTVARFLITALA
ncbi:MAG TPA: magnesium transporter [Cellulomonas sp.]